jgi:hypothetical protein
MRIQTDILLGAGLGAQWGCQRHAQRNFRPGSQGSGVDRMVETVPGATNRTLRCESTVASQVARNPPRSTEGQDDVRRNRRGEVRLAG